MLWYTRDALRATEREKRVRRFRDFRRFKFRSLPFLRRTERIRCICIDWKVVLSFILVFNYDSIDRIVECHVSLSFRINLHTKKYYYRRCQIDVLITIAGRNFSVYYMYRLYVQRVCRIYCTYDNTCDIQEIE